MQTTVNTSQLFERRLLGMEEKMEKMEKAIKEKDFHSFAEFSMKVRVHISPGQILSWSLDHVLYFEKCEKLKISFLKWLGIHILPEKNNSYVTK